VRASKTRVAAATTSRWLLALLLVTAACVGSKVEEVPPGPTERTQFPDVSLDNLRERDERLTLNDLAEGRPAVVNFFASWCGPCKRELPLFVEAFEKHGGGVAFVGIDTEDSASEGLEMLQRYGIEYPALYDPDAKIRNALGRSGLPVTAFVGPDGTVVRLLAREVTAEELDAAIQELVEIGHKAPE
jgi:cytochrome c biogenesis protein CcmG/thiol:disulfide interchange protein DsbE